jgi:hypothetical protein
MRKTERPDNRNCPKSEGLLKRHDWHYSHHWNGNNRKVLPFVESTRGIARSGWRCQHCGAFVWDKTDLEFALGVTYGLRLIKLPEPIRSESTHAKGADAG